tara:strand:+ start:4065 stop:4673 length:609 start_codon:yes stop_codon:yes gene_type:complete
MGKLIKLKESDIARIVQRILKEEEGKKMKGKGKQPTSAKDLKKLTKSQESKVKSAMFSGSVEQSLKNYTMMYNKAPKWAKSKSLTPSQVKARLAEGTPPEEEPATGLIWIIVHIFCWAIVAWWYFDPNFPSDVRLKENINRTGSSKSGIPIYTFNYKNDDKLWSGTMAQDLLDMGMNEAVAVMDSGYYAVNYNMIDVDMTSL